MIGMEQRRDAVFFAHTIPLSAAPLLFSPYLTDSSLTRLSAGSSDHYRKLIKPASCVMI